MSAELGPLTAAARVLVAGAGLTGRSVLAVLAPLDVRAELTDDNAAVLAQRAAEGVATVPAATAAARVADYAVVITSPGLPPSSPLLLAAAAARVPVWGDVELAWRLDRSGRFGPPRRWLVVTGTNGKTTTTSMLHEMLLAGGRASLLCGNIGTPVIDVLAQPGDHLAVELSSFQLHWSESLRPEAGVVLNVAEDHLDWHGSLPAYAADKARALTGRVAVAGVDDPIAAGLLAAAPASTRVGFRLGEPGPGELGVRDGMLVDRAFGPDDNGGVPLAPVSSIPVAGPVGVLDALAAAALVRAVGVAPEAIAAALAGFRVGPHRAEVVAVVDGVSYVDDSKATNPHAAEASVRAHPRVVWLAGGLLKGASVEEMLARVGDRLSGAVLFGRDRRAIAEALSRHAPDVPIVEVVTGEDAGVDGTGVTRVTIAGGEPVGSAVMVAAVAAARNLATPGDTVLLAPAGASFDQFSGYGDRGDRFAAAVRALDASTAQGGG